MVDHQLVAVDAVRHQSCPSLYRMVLANVLRDVQADRIVPLPVDPVNGTGLMRLRVMNADVIYLDAGHEEASVAADLAPWWPILRATDLSIADDCVSRGEPCPGVQRAD